MTIISIGLNKEKLSFNEKGYANLTLFIGDDTDNYGQNVSAVIEQTKEQRDNKEPRIYVGNGKVVWTETGLVKVADKVDQGTTAKEQSTAGRSTPDLPF